MIESTIQRMAMVRPLDPPYDCWTSDNVRESLTAVPVQGMKQWLRENLATTLTSKRATQLPKFSGVIA